LLGSPFSGWILAFFSNSAHGMAGWRWMYLLQGIPTIPLGIALYFFLSDGAAQAKWLSPNERTGLERALAEDEKNQPAAVVSSFRLILLSPAVWILSFIYFCIEAGVYSINFWLPTIVKQSGVSSVMAIGWLSAIPYLAAFVFMIIVGRSADAWKERRWHLNVPMGMGVIGLVLAAAFASNTIVAMVGLTLAGMGTLAALAMFWPMGSSFLTASAAAGGVALINSLGQFAGLLSPYFVGWIEQTTQSTYLALYCLAALLLVGALLVLWVPAKVVNR
jgi:sugar phosphate permease